MNERIKELFLHAFPPSLNDSALVNQSAEKFAELMVQECVNVLHDNELWNPHISHALNEHFGVEK